MEELEVMPQDANYVIIFSESFKAKRVLRKVFVKLSGGESAADAMRYVVDTYPELIQPNVRIDIYKVRCGRVFGGN